MAQDLQKLYGIPNSSTRVGNSNGNDIYYDPTGKKYYEVRNNLGGLVAPDQAAMAQKFGKKASDVTEPYETIKIAGVPATADSTGVVSYPHAHKISPTSDYVSFEFFKYKPPFAAAVDGKTDLQTAYSASADFGSGDNILGEKKGTCLLYMPEDIQAEYGANWGGAGFGLMSREIGKMFGGGQFDVTTAFDAVRGTGKKAIIDAIVKGANTALGTSVTTNQATGGIYGQIVNPNVEMMYEAPEMRGFSLQFKMTPVNQKEAAAIKSICTMFKKNMLPEWDEGTFISVPNVVRVTFMTGPSPNAYIPQYKPCAITNVSINSTAEGAWAAYEGGAPVSTILSIQFKELKMVFANDISEQGASY
jgi:hypothetical protein